MKMTFAAGAIAALTLTAPAHAGSPMAGLFAQDAALSNEFEIAEAKVILEDSTNPKLRAFAKDMLRDHGLAQAKLARAGRAAGVSTALDFDNGRNKLVDDIGLMEGDQLDKTYIADQVTAHASAAAGLAAYAATGDDPALRAYARDALPTVRMHQRMLQMMTGQPSPI